MWVGALMVLALWSAQHTSRSFPFHYNTHLASAGNRGKNSISLPVSPVFWHMDGTSRTLPPDQPGGCLPARSFQEGRCAPRKPGARTMSIAEHSRAPTSLP